MYLLGKNIAEALNSQTTVEQLLKASFSVLSAFYRRKVGTEFFLEHIVHDLFYDVSTLSVV
jgi:hypothetical protein